MNFYNEHDPKAAAWLRELIALIRVLQMDTSCGPIERGRWGIKPTPFQAICSFWSSAIGRFARILACAPHPERGIRRSFHRLLVHLDYIAETVQDWNLEIASLLCVGDTRIPFQDCAGETLSPILPLAPFGRHQNKSISDSGLAELGTSCHNGDNHALLPDLGDSSSDTQRHTFVNKSFLREGHCGHCRNGYMV